MTLWTVWFPFETTLLNSLFSSHNLQVLPLSQYAMQRAIFKKN